MGSGVVARGCSCPLNMWDLLGSETEHLSPALAGGFFTEPPGKPEHHRLPLIVSFRGLTRTSFVFRTCGFYTCRSVY